MAILADQFPPSEQTGYGRAVAETADTSALAQIFPSKTQPTNVASWRRRRPVKNEAKYRSWGGETEFGRRGGQDEVTQKLAPLGLKLPYTEDDAVAVVNGLVAEQDVVDELTTEVSGAVINTLQKQRAGALENAAYTAEGENFSVPVEFDRNPDHSPTATTLWDATGSDPVEYLGSLIETVRRNGGVRPDTLITSSRVFAALARSSAMISYAGGTTKTTLVTRDAIQATLEAFGLPQIVLFDELDAAEAPLLSDHKVYLARTGGASGRTAWGPSTAALNEKYGIARGDAPGLFVGVYEEEDADTKYVRSDAQALAILENPDSTAAAAVLAAS